MKNNLLNLIIICFSLIQVLNAADQVVTNNNDSGAGSLRQAIADVGAGESITFNLSSGNETITLSSELAISKNLTINGSNLAGSGNFIIIQAAASANTATYRVLNISSGTIVLNNLTFRYGNIPSGTFNAGAGIEITSGASVIINACNILDNTCYYSGGGIDVYQSTLTISNSTIANNTGEKGGGIFSSASTITITNTTFYGNIADNSYGGGLYFADGTANLMNCTICENSCVTSSGGGGIEADGVSLTIQNTILANNTGGGSSNDFDYFGATVSNNGFNIVESSNGYTWSGSGDITGDQVNLFGTAIASTPSLADNTTTNGTQTLKTVTGSVAIDAGSNSNSAPTTDQRGVERNGITDIGAYEWWSDSGALPVELTSFCAVVIERNVQLNWQTATEVDNYGFNVECRMNNLEWKTIGFVEGAGNSNSPKTYQFTDYDYDKDKNLDGIIFYRLKQIDTDGSYEYSDAVLVNVDTPEEYALNQNYPNPFNPSTIIRFNLLETGFVDLRVFDVLGKEIACLINSNMIAGQHAITFDANNLAAGIYFYKMNVDGKFSSVKKMLLVK